jgi:hypothetical protein
MRSSVAAIDGTAAHGVSPDLAVAAEIGAALIAAPSLTGLLAVLRKRLKWLLPATHVSLCLLEDDGLRYRVLTAGGSEESYSVEEGLVGWALRHRTALDTPDLQDETRYPPGVGGVALHHGQGALLVLPLHADGGERLIGALTIGSPRVGAYVAVDRGIVNLMVLQVTAAVRTMLLMAELDGAEAIITGMARAVEAKDHYTQGHAARVTTYALALAGAAGLPTRIRDIIVQAGPLHDVGKIGVPDDVLGKPGRLTDDEFALIKRHPEIGDEICRPLRSLRRVLGGVRHHHERYDGRGYPDGLAGQDIPLEARVLAIADTYDAMTSTRPYRAGMPVERALGIIAANAGPQWDPALVPLFCALHAGGG